jgi:hypothetical protein
MFCRTRGATPFESRWSAPFAILPLAHNILQHEIAPAPSSSFCSTEWAIPATGAIFLAAISQNRHRSPVFGELHPRTCFLPYFWIEPHLISLPHLRSIRCITGISTTTTGAPHHRQGSPPLSLHCCPAATVSPRRGNFALCVPLATSMLTPPVGLHLIHR